MCSSSSRGNGILSAMLGSTVDAFDQRVANSAEVTLSYACEKWDAYKESRVTIAASAAKVQGWQSGTSSYAYDAHGHLRRLYDSQAQRSIDYVNNQYRQVLKRDRRLICTRWIGRCSTI